MSIMNKFMNYKNFFYFALVGGFGTVLNTGILYLLTSFANMNYIFASVIATESAIISNFIGNNYITFRNKDKNNNIFRKFAFFQLISLFALVGTIFFLWLFVTLFGKNLLLVWNVIAIIIMFVVNFILNSAFTWKNNVTRINSNTVKGSKKKQSIKSALIILFIALLILMIPDINAKAMTHKAPNDSISDKSSILTTDATINQNDNTINTQTTNQSTGKHYNSSQSQNSRTNKQMNTITMKKDNVKIKTSGNNISLNNTEIPIISTGENIIVQDKNLTIHDTNKDTKDNKITLSTNDNQTTKTTENQTIDNTDNQNVNNTNLNQTINDSTHPIISSINSINIQAINQTINNTDNQTTNDTINNTDNQTINNTDNQTINDTDINQTINDTINNTTNQTINNTINDTTNNQTINQTTNNSTTDTTNNTSINQTTNNSTTNTTTNVTNNTSNNSSNIISKGTDLNSISLNGVTTYYMHEDATANFYLNLDSDNTVTWYVDGIEQLTTTVKNSTFTWSPGILWVPRAPDYSNIAMSTISAVYLDTTFTWDVNIENVINPFFTGINDGADVIGSPDTKIHVFSNNNIVNFTGLNVTITNSDGNMVYQLVKQFSSVLETDWSIYIPDIITSGNNYLTNIIGYNNDTGLILTYDIGTSRAHYKTPTVSAVSSSSGSSRKHSGSGSSSSSTVPELVYITLVKDVVTINQTQTITLDAKNFRGGIDAVSVDLLTPDKKFRELQLKLTEGTKEYGTWSVNFGDLIPGQYNITAAVLKSALQTLPMVIKVENRSFYYADSINAINANLSLVYSVLDANNVKDGTLVTLTIDAKDSSGITTINALIINTQGNNKTSTNSFYIPLSLVDGSTQYGTWKGTFNVTQPDSTYRVSNITLSNLKDTKSYPVIGRSVYVQAISKQTVNESISSQSKSLLSITGAIIQMPFTQEGIKTIMKNPFTPTILGFILTIIVAIMIISISKRS